MAEGKFNLESLKNIARVAEAYERRNPGADAQSGWWKEQVEKAKQKPSQLKHAAE